MQLNDDLQNFLSTVKKRLSGGRNAVLLKTSARGTLSRHSEISLNFIPSVLQQDENE